MGKDTVLRVEITYAGQQKISFEYELELAFLTSGESNRVRVAFQKDEPGKGDKYRLEIPLKTACVTGVQAQATLVPDTFRLQVGSRLYSDVKPCMSQAEVNDIDDYEALQGSVLQDGDGLHRGKYISPGYLPCKDLCGARRKYLFN